ncbi:MAG: MFS transporter [Pseudonocardiaceae bacterium]|nr:MFS transporter [Pseudonocardiaceae bacterium]
MLLGATLTTFFGYATLLPVVPLWAVRGGASAFVGGTTTGVFMGITVLTQIAVPRLTRAVGYRWTFLLGAALIGLPAPLYALSDAAEPLLLISALRGVGFGIITVCGSALVAELLPRAELGRGSGLYGVAVGVPQLLGVPAGIWVAEAWGYPAVFWAAGVLPVLGCLPAALLPRVDGHAAPAGEVGGLLSQLRPLLGPWLVMLAAALAYGAVVTFTPMSLAVAPVALLAVGAAMLAGRWASGMVGDRMGVAGRQLPLSVLLGVSGLLAIAAAVAGDGPWLAVLGGLLFGAGYGVVQNDSLVAMFDRVPPHRYGMASAGWNIALDGGYGLGAVLIGAVVSGPGFVAAFLVTAGLVLLTLAPAWYAARRAVTWGRASSRRS